MDSLTCTPVGGKEVADRLGVKRETVAMWKRRGLLPPARWTVSGEDAWDWVEDIEPWAKQTGRLRAPTVHWVQCEHGRRLIDCAEPLHGARVVDAEAGLRAADEIK